MSKITYPLKCCPWCGKTAVFYMSTPLDETWLPRINCGNFSCKVKPQTTSVPIRKRQRGDPTAIRSKVERVVKFWNDGNLMFNNEGFGLDFEEIAQDFKDGTVGKPGHRQQ
jgi:hypothetical protein